MIGEVLALDYDDCFKPFTRPFLGYVHRETGVLLQPEEAVPGAYHFDDAHPTCGISADEFTELIDSFMLQHSVDIEPFEGSVEAVRLLATKVCDVHVVTARDAKYEDVTLQSIEKNIGSKFLKGIHVMGSADGAKKTKKTDTYVLIGASSAADDADHNINAALEVGLTGFSVQHKGLYHSGHKLDERAIVVSSLSEILKYAETSVR